MNAVNLIIRPEATADHEAIRQLHRQAFGGDEEACLVDALRDGGYVRVSLVAEKSQQVVGHILFSDLPIITPTGTVPALSLAPLAVLPMYQRQGIGSALVRRGLEVCKDQGHRIVVVVGHPGFYRRFGFSARLAARLEAPFGGESFMAAELMPGALNEVAGKVVYPAPFKIAAPAPENQMALALNLVLLQDTFAVCKLEPTAPIPLWATTGELFSITHTAEELSIVCRQDAVPEGILCERNWRCLRVAGKIPFTIVGVLAALTRPLAEARISVFVVSTFDTDWLLVKEKDLASAADVLRQQGHAVVDA